MGAQFLQFKFNIITHSFLFNKINFTPPSQFYVQLPVFFRNWIAYIVQKLSLRHFIISIFYLIYLK